MTEQQWNEFLDKLDFVQLTDRWQMLPLHWLDSDFPENLDALAQDLVSKLLEVKESTEAGDERDARVAELCAEYRSQLASKVLHLDARLCPPGSRVSLKFLDPADLGEGDCLITVASWDRVGHMILEKATPGGEHTEAVGETPIRVDPGELSYRHIMLFPDKGTPSPRAFRALCEKTLRQARGLGCKHFTITHLHLSQEGLADRFAAAELVSAVRQMLRDGPGTTVNILAFSHRNYEDYEHWFESLKELTKSSESESGYERPDREPRQTESAQESEVSDTFRQFAKKSSEFASEATASVSRWLSSATAQQDENPIKAAWRKFTHDEKVRLAKLHLKMTDDVPPPESTEILGEYISCLHQTVVLEKAEGEAESGASFLRQLRTMAGGLGPNFPLTRYFRLLELRISNLLNESPEALLAELEQSAKAWEDHAMLRYLQEIQEDSAQDSLNPPLPPVSPGGSRFSLD